MTLKELTTSLATALVLTGATLSMPSMAASDSGFASLQGVEAQALSPQEMAAISGELNAYDISAALQAAGANLARFPRLQAATLKLAAYYLTNAEKINAAFGKLGILTPCTSSLCP